MHKIFILLCSLLAILNHTAAQDKTKIEKLLEFVKVEGGKFVMGDSTKGCYNTIAIPHNVELSTFYIQKTEVTQELWESVMGENPSENKIWKDNPVTNVSWNDCKVFIQKLNDLTGKKYRLPTEAEWEYAAKGGKKSKGYKFAGSDNIDEVAWVYDNSNDKIHPTAEKKENELGLLDMTGNVWEWCEDWYGEYRMKNLKNPKGPDNGTEKIFRGGSRHNSADECRISYRCGSFPDEKGEDVFIGEIGLRLVKDE